MSKGKIILIVLVLVVIGIVFFLLPKNIFSPSTDNTFGETFDQDLSEDIYSGIGAEIYMQNNQLVIVSLFKDGPGEKAGLLDGDKILEIDGIDSGTYTIEESIEHIRGKQNTVVKLLIFREGWDIPKEFSITRQVVKFLKDREIVITLPTNAELAENGQVDMREVPDGVSVEITLWGGVAIGVDHTANLREGICDKFGTVRHELSPVTDSVSPIVPDYVLDGTPVKQSFTTLNISVDDLMRQLPLAVDVRFSKEDQEKSVACVSVVNF